MISILGDIVTAAARLPLVAQKRERFPDLTEEQQKELDFHLRRGALGILAGTLGAIFWKDHRVLGFLGASRVGSSIPLFFRKERRVEAVCGLAAEGIAVGCSLKWKEHPALGYIGGSMVGGAGTALVPEKFMKEGL